MTTSQPKRRPRRKPAAPRAQGEPTTIADLRRKEAIVAARGAARARRSLISGSVLLLLGLGMVGIDTTDVGAGVTLLGLLILIFGIHSFGRLGPEEPRLIEAADA